MKLDWRSRLANREEGESDAMTRVEERVVVGTRGKIGWSDGGSGDKRRPGNLVNCRLSSPGGGSDRNYDWRADRRAARQRGRKGKSELGNERTWPSGSALSRKPSRRSGPIKRRPPFLQLGRLYFIISNSFFNMAVQHWPLRSAFFSSRGSFSRRLWPRVPAFRWWRKIGWKLWGKMVFSSFFFFFFWREEEFSRYVGDEFYIAFSLWMFITPSNRCFRNIAGYVAGCIFVFIYQCPQINSTDFPAFL